MKKITFIFSILFPFTSLAAPNPLKFSEETEFLSTAENPAIDFNKTDSFLGIITRKGIHRADQRTIDLYQFKNIKERRMNMDLCEKLAEQVFGPEQEISLITTNKELFKTPRNGNVCEITLRDPEKDEKFKERRFYAFISREKFYGIVSRLQTPAKDDEVEDLRKFIRGLKQP